MSDKARHINKLTALLSDRDLEREYQKYSAIHESVRERSFLYFAIWLYCAYGVLDLMVLEKVALEAVITRGVCASFAFGIVYLSRYRIVQKYFQFIAAGIMCVGAFSISYFIWREGTISPPYYVGIIVVALLFSALVRGYFLVSLFSFVLIYFSYVIATVQFPKGTEYVASLFFLIHSLILCASVVYVLEMKRRIEFLQNREAIRLNSRLQMMVEDANLSLKRKNAILNILTHVFRTPLHQIIGYAQILEQESLGKQEHPEYVEYSSHIHQAGQNLLRLVQRLMKYGRLETGTVVPSLQKIPVSELVSCALSGVSHKASDKRVQIEYERSKISLNADSNLMEDALFEIIANAVEATPEGGTVKVWAEQVDSDVHIYVEDEGPGIDGEQLDNIRNSMELTEEFLDVSEKMSLGVTLTEKIIALHDGELDFRRGTNGGTIVRLSLPTVTSTSPDETEDKDISAERRPDQENMPAQKIA